jgi:ribosome biogenesis GTPase
LLNAIDNSLNIQTSEISEKLGRGKHTTRHAQLYKLEHGGYVADTPGFSTFETNKYEIIHKEELADCFTEFKKYKNDCKFHNCSHTKEKDCAVIEAVRNGEISESRHESYCRMYEEAKQIREWELK